MLARLLINEFHALACRHFIDLFFKLAIFSDIQTEQTNCRRKQKFKSRFFSTKHIIYILHTRIYMSFSRPVWTRFFDRKKVKLYTATIWGKKSVHLVAEMCLKMLLFLRLSRREEFHHGWFRYAWKKCEKTKKKEGSMYTLVWHEI
jgi:hypothetical protein